MPAAPPTPAAAGEIFGDRLELAERYVGLLADTGISHGLVGPREAPRLWDRHLLNCAVAAEALAADAMVVDIGSGAGLPGIVLAIARPDLRLHLVEPLARRTVWLESTVAELALGNVTVTRARAEAMPGQVLADHVTARAVTGLARLVELSFPLLRVGGSLVALKGESATAEVEAAAAVLRRYAVSDVEVRHVGIGIVDPPTTLVIVARPAVVAGRVPSGAGRRRQPAGSGLGGPGQGSDRESDRGSPRGSSRPARGQRSGKSPRHGRSGPGPRDA